MRARSASSGPYGAPRVVTSTREATSDDRVQRFAAERAWNVVARRSSWPSPRPHLSTAASASDDGRAIRFLAGRPSRSRPWPTTRRQRRAGRDAMRRSSTRLRNTPRISRSRTRTRRARSRRSSDGAADQHPGQRQRQADGRDRFRSRAHPRGRRQDRQRGAVRVRADLFGGVPRPNMPAGPDPSGRDDRVPAPAVPVRAADRRRCGAQRRLPAALSSIRSISSASIAKSADAGAAGPGQSRPRRPGNPAA